MLWDKLRRKLTEEEPIIIAVLMAFACVGVAWLVTFHMKD